MWNRNVADLSPDVPPLGNLNQSKLYSRRTEGNSSYISFGSEYDNLPPSQLNIQAGPVREQFRSLNLNVKKCARCTKDFEKEPYLEALGKLWHKQCFVCVQCFQILKHDEVFIEDGRAYCKHDYETLFSVICVKCSKPIHESVVRAKNCCWHPECLRCEFPVCGRPLNEGYAYSFYYGKMACRACDTKYKEENARKNLCAHCFKAIDTKRVTFDNKFYHPYHFNCPTCGVDLDENAMEFPNKLTSKRELHCYKCYTKLPLKICCACRAIHEKNELIMRLDKYWHPEHFVCATCSKQLNDSRPYYEHKGYPYCESHYLEVSFHTCEYCNKGISRKAIRAGQKMYCLGHFICVLCDKQINFKKDYKTVDLQPVCSKCFVRVPPHAREQIIKSIHWPTEKKSKKSKLGNNSTPKGNGKYHFN